jgi:hypothetical protein
MLRTPLDQQFGHSHRLISTESRYTSLNILFIFDFFLIAVYRENVSMNANNSTTLCRHLHAQHGVEIKINYENQTQEDGFSCEPGKLGNNCTIRCKDILGVDKQYCQEYKICYDSKCVCAWGYKGSECDSRKY